MRVKRNVLFCALLALVVALVGCGGGEPVNADGGGTKTGATASTRTEADGDAETGSAVSPQQDDDESFVGVWQIESMVDDGEETSDDEIALMRSMGFDVYLKLEEDGSATLNLFGEEMDDGAWEATSATEGTIYFEDDSDEAAMSLDGDTLTLSADDTSMVFFRSSEEAIKDVAAAADDDDVDVATPASSGIDDEFIRLTIREVYVDSSNDLTVRYDITNKTDKYLTFTDKSGDFTVNGKDADITCITSMEPGETVEDDFLFFSDAGGLVDDIDDVTFSGVFEVRDDDYNTLATYDFTL